MWHLTKNPKQALDESRDGSGMDAESKRLDGETIHLDELITILTDPYLKGIVMPVCPRPLQG